MIHKWYWSVFLVFAWHITLAISQSANCTGDFKPLEKVYLSVFDPGLFYVFPSYTVAEQQCIKRTECCFYETGRPQNEANCNMTIYRDYMVNLGNPTMPCTNYTVLVTAYSKDNRTASRTFAFSSGAVSVSSINVNKSSSGRSVIVSWTSPERNALCVTSQTWTFNRKLDGVVLATREVSKEITQETFNDLEPCTSYEFKIKLQVRIHYSPMETFKIFQTLSNVTALTSVNVTAVEQDVILVTYAFPEVSSRCVSHIYLCWEASDTNDSSCLNMSTSAHPRHYILNLVTDTNYTVNATLVAPDGHKYLTTTAIGHTLQCDVSVVTDIKVDVDERGQSANVTWTNPKENLKCAAEQHIYCVQVEDHKTLVDEDVPTSTTSLAIDNLEPCTNYSVAIQPRNWNPILPAAQSSYFKSHSNVTSLSSLKVAGLSADTLLVIYEILQVSSFCVHHFDICWTQNGSTSCVNKRGHASSSTEITGLASYTNYTVTVTPVAPDGTKYQSSSRICSTIDKQLDPLVHAEIFDLGCGLFYVFYNYADDVTRYINHTSVCFYEAMDSGGVKDCKSTSEKEYLVNQMSGSKPCTNYIVLVTAFYNDNTTATRMLNITSNAAEVTDVIQR